MNTSPEPRTRTHDVSPADKAAQDALVRSLRLENQRLREALALRTTGPEPPQRGLGPAASLLVSLVLLVMIGAVAYFWDAPPDLFHHDAPSVQKTSPPPAAVPATPPELSTTKRVYDAGEDIEVLWGGLPGSSTDWITVINQGAPDNQYGQWTYTQGKQIGRHTFTPLPPGEYEARVYYNWAQGGYVVRGRQAFSVHAPVQETTGEPAYSGVKVRARLTFDGRPITQVTPLPPRFWFRNEDIGKEAHPVTQYRDGLLEITHLEGSRMGIQTRIDLIGTNAVDYPGDLRAWTNLNVPTQDGTEIEIPLLQLIHLTAPQDNAAIMEGWERPCADKPAFAAPFEIAWDGLGDSVDYEVLVTRVDCANNYRVLETVLFRRLAATSLTAQLPPSGRDEVYMLTLKASRAGTPIGQLITHGANGMGWDYRFRVKGPVE